MRVSDEEMNEIVNDEMTHIFVSMRNVSSMIEDAIIRAVAVITKLALRIEDISMMIKQMIARMLNERQEKRGFHCNH